MLNAVWTDRTQVQQGLGQQQYIYAVTRAPQSLADATYANIPHSGNSKSISATCYAQLSGFLRFQLVSRPVNV